MLDRIPESDWRLFRNLRQVALERFCDRLLKRIGKLSSDSSKTFHERYLLVYRFIRRRDQDLGRAFDDPRRSRAVVQLALMCSQKLIKPEELVGFSAATRDRISVLAELSERPRRSRKEEI